MGTKWDAATYLIIGKDRYNRPKIIKSTSKTPALESGQIAVKVVLNIDMGIFDSFTPVVTADIDDTKQVIVPPTIAVINQNGVAMKSATQQGVTP